MRIEYTHWECIRIENVYALGMYTPEFTYVRLFIVVSKNQKSRSFFYYFGFCTLERNVYIRIENVYTLRIYTHWEYTSKTILRNRKSRSSIIFRVLYLREKCKRIENIYALSIRIENVYALRMFTHRECIRCYSLFL